MIRTSALALSLAFASTSALASQPAADQAAPQGPAPVAQQQSEVRPPVFKLSPLPPAVRERIQQMREAAATGKSSIPLPVIEIGDKRVDLNERVQETKR